MWACLSSSYRRTTEVKGVRTALGGEDDMSQVSSDRRGAASCGATDVTRRSEVGTSVLQAFRPEGLGVCITNQSTLWSVCARHGVKGPDSPASPQGHCLLWHSHSRQGRGSDRAPVWPPKAGARSWDKTGSDPKPPLSGWGPGHPLLSSADLHTPYLSHPSGPPRPTSPARNRIWGWRPLPGGVFMRAPHLPGSLPPA